MAPRPAAPCVLLVLSIIAAAVGPADGDHLRGVALIDADVLKAWIDEGRQILVIGSRVAGEDREGHIPTAISVPAHTMDKHRHTFPGDHAYPLVFYCNGWPECKKSHEASTKAVEWGYTRVYWLREGLPAWQVKRYPLE